MTTIEARHPAICPACEKFIQVGDRIVKDHGPAWVHERCPEGSKFDFNPDDVCGGCWTIRAVSGKCACAQDGSQP